MVYCGIDPGLTGAIALYDPSINWLELHDCPSYKLNGKGFILLSEVINVLQSVSITGCVVEKSQAMPKQGVSSMFSYGVGYGSYLGILATLQISHSKVSPQEWKKVLRVPSDKDGARARASEILPAHSGLWARKKDHGRAEAALLAYFAANYA